MQFAMLVSNSFLSNISRCIWSPKVNAVLGKRPLKKTYLVLKYPERNKIISIINKTT
jgi:hypothetical protein